MAGSIWFLRTSFYGRTISYSEVHHFQQYHYHDEAVIIFRRSFPFTFRVLSLSRLRRGILRRKLRHQNCCEVYFKKGSKNVNMVNGNCYKLTNPL